MNHEITNSSQSVLGENHSEFLSQLQSVLESRFPSEKAATITQFAKIYYAASPITELLTTRKDDLYGATVSAWEFLQTFNAVKPKLRVYNPEFEQHGWQSNHSVVEVLCKDIPFLVDSVRMVLNRSGIVVHSICNSVYRASRDEKHGLLEIKNQIIEVESARQMPSAEEGMQAEAFLHVEVARESNRQTLKKVEEAIIETVKELELVVCDFTKMLKVAGGLATQLKKGMTLWDNASSQNQSIENQTIKNSAQDAVNEAFEFINWMIENHFTFLGGCEYQLENEGAGSVLKPVVGSELGILRSSTDIDLLNDVMQAPVKNGPGFSLKENDDTGQNILVFAKSATKSKVHRPAYPDIVVVRQYNEEGNYIGEYRFIGLYTSQVYSDRTQSIPVIRQKVNEVIKLSGFGSNGHDGKFLQQIIETFPREELFQISQVALFETVVGILHMQERPILKLFMRQDIFGRFVSAIIYTPKETYNTELRNKFQQVLQSNLPVLDLEYSTVFSESILARAQITLRVDTQKSVHYNVVDIENCLKNMARNWDDDLVDALVETCGEESGFAYASQFKGAFPASYREDVETRTAVYDVQKMLELDSDQDLGMTFYRSLGDDAKQFRFKLFRANDVLPLSQVLPILEHLGLSVMAARPYDIVLKDGRRFYINNFSVHYGESAEIKIDDVQDIFQDAFDNVWHGRAENDGFNRLVLGVGLDWRTVAMLRAYAKYLKQVCFGFSQQYIETVLAKNVHVTHCLCALFFLRFDPARNIGSDHKEKLLLKEIYQQLDAVENLDEDRILRRYLDVMLGTVRTNYFQKEEGGLHKPYMSFKFTPDKIPDLPKPLPMFEIFVYSPQVEGVHLRGGKVARGGLRWSDRPEDFRTEVLGLVKAQQVKNAVIVPVGAKGGFVCKTLPEHGSREDIMTEVVSCYQTFIRGLLDITDNICSEGDKKTSVVPPENVRRMDGDDPYLVVAADKGTATFSDIANDIAEEYKFWLGDAFASGGSVGYDHKKMGITARGAWVSVQRHFREIGVDVQTTEFTVVGIGDMAGDVFGNGMLLSEHIRLVAAFNHKHIFIDPNPDAATSFEERQRLFTLPRSSWADFNKKLISKGGGIFLKSAKSIRISPEMQLRFDINSSMMTNTTMTPADLISTLMKAPVDLIWNGGIGTYAKGAGELNSNVGDKANDAVRIDGNQIRAQVIGEGGNLGFTQLSRVEYSLSGGLSNTDFIDNAGGVDCSDHEVNIKILLNDVVLNGDMTLKQRNEMLVEMTNDVSQLVLDNNCQQVQAISLAQVQSADRIGEYRRLIQYLELEGKLDRELEFIPSDESLTERESNGLGLSRPEISVLVSYCKANLKEELITSKVPDDTYVAQALTTAFPPAIVSQFSDQLEQHKLRREIIATQVANDLVNYMGPTFIHRMMDAAGANVPDIAKAFVIAKDVFRMEEIWVEIETFDFKIAAQDQMHMMLELMRLVRRGARWFLRNKRCELIVSEAIERFSPGVLEVSKQLPTLLVGSRLSQWEDNKASYREKGFSDQLSGAAAGSNSLLPVLGIIEAAGIAKRPVTEVAQYYYALGDKLDLFWFAQSIDELPVENHWQALAREAFRDDLDWQQRSLTVSVLQMGGGEALRALLISGVKDISIWLAVGLLW